MRHPLGCYRCGEQCGWADTYDWGPYGQDPPEAKPWDESLVDDEGRCFCSPECLEGLVLTDYFKEEANES